MCAGPSLLPKEEAQVSAQVHSQLPLPTRLTFVLSFPRNTKQSTYFEKSFLHPLSLPFLFILSPLHLKLSPTNKNIYKILHTCTSRNESSSIEKTSWIIQLKWQGMCSKEPLFSCLSCSCCFHQCSLNYLQTRPTPWWVCLSHLTFLIRYGMLLKTHVLGRELIAALATRQ
jgi:hypothetical protein